MANVESYERSSAEYKLEKKRANSGMRSQVIMFAFMIFLTVAAFAIVLAYQADVAGFSAYMVFPLLLLIGGVMATVQLFYFMHMNEKNHEVAWLFMFIGVLIAFLTVLTFLTIVWWN